MRKASESVTAGHPDKVCDQIADGLVDEYLRRDESASVNIKVLGSNGMVMIGGEVRSYADFDVALLVKQIYASVGYQDEIEVFANIQTMSGETKKGLRTAMDAVVVNGYATGETREMLPRAQVYANNLVRRLDDVRKSDPALQWLLPDGKVQVIMERDRVLCVTVQAAHLATVNPSDIQTAILDRVVTPITGESGIQVFINPLGAFTKAGFASGAGMSGQKMACDTYGGLIPHGDSSLSGKDPSRVDRAGAYMARFVARSIVSRGLASSALVNVVYSPGRAEPVHLEVSGVLEKSRGSKMDFTNLIKQEFDFRTDAIVERFQLLKPIYQQTAVYGHFGRTGFPWEETVV